MKVQAARIRELIKQKPDLGDIIYNAIRDMEDAAEAK
jgi:hypothetical protein